VIGVPHPAGKLHLDLRVGAERFLADGPPLRRRQLDPAQLYLAQLRERQREHDVIGGHVMKAGTAGERARVPAVPAAAHRHETLPQVDRAAGQPAEESPDELIVAFADVPLLVGGRQDRVVLRLPAAARAAAGQLAPAAAASPAPAAPPRTCRRDSPSPVRAPPGCSPQAGSAACSASTLVASPMSHPVRCAYRAAACAHRSARIAGDDPGPMTTPHLALPRHRPARSRGAAGRCREDTCP
jgi:hypothetical protein